MKVLYVLLSEMGCRPSLLGQKKESTSEDDTLVRTTRAPEGLGLTALRDPSLLDTSVNGGTVSVVLSEYSLKSASNNFVHTEKSNRGKFRG